MTKCVSNYDRHIAERLKAARKQCGMSQTTAGARLGVTFQQMQKTERATNRISAGNLFILARAYGVPVSWFYEGLGEISTKENLSLKLISSSHGADLARNYLAIKSSVGRKAVVDAAAALAQV